MLYLQGINWYALFSNESNINNVYLKFKKIFFKRVEFFVPKKYKNGNNYLIPKHIKKII